jgi:hypothetical protein
VQVGADGGRKFDVKDVSGRQNYVGPAAFAPQGTVLGSLSVLKTWFSDPGINALQDHTPSSFVHPLPVPLLAHGGRLAGRSSVSAQVAGACKRNATALAKREKARALGARKARRSRHANRSRSALAAGLLVKHTCFRPFSIGNLDWKSGVHVPIWAILERETGSNAKSNPYFGRWNAGGRGPIQKNGLDM